MNTRELAQMFVDSRVADTGPICSDEENQMRNALIEALENDLENLGSEALDEWTEDEIDLMVLGEDGEIPSHLKERWPETHRILNEHLGYIS
jgi:hypothetical protein